MDWKKALEKCMQICSQREYCISDITEKLFKWEVDSKFHDRIITKLSDEKFIDHNRYAKAFVNDKFKFNHWGRVKISYHLKYKGIEKDIIDACLHQINDQEYGRVISQEIEKKKRNVKANSEFERNQKIAKYVISKGFEPGLVFKLLNFD